MVPKKLTNWSAKRAGTGMTVTGLDEAGTEHKVTGVSRIFRRPASFGQPEVRTIAYAGNGREVELV